MRTPFLFRFVLIRRNQSDFFPNEYGYFFFYNEPTRNVIVIFLHKVLLVYTDK